MTSELVPIFRDLQKYFKEMEMGRTGDRGNRRIGVVLNEHKFTKKNNVNGRIGKTETNSPFRPFVHSPSLFKYFANSNSISTIRRFNIFFANSIRLSIKPISIKN